MCEAVSLLIGGAAHRDNVYGGRIRECFGGAPEGTHAAVAEARKRSPIHYLSRKGKVPMDLAAGRFDSTVSITHSLRAMQLIAPGSVSDAEIAELTAPGAGLRTPSPADTAADPLFARRLFLRRRSGTSRLTIFDGGHEWLPRAAIAWLATQRRR